MWIVWTFEEYAQVRPSNAAERVVPLVFWAQRPPALALLSEIRQAK
jgi:hypothetical protein